MNRKTKRLLAQIEKDKKERKDLEQALKIDKMLGEKHGPNIYRATHCASGAVHFLVGYYDPVDDTYEVLHQRSPGGTKRGTFSQCRTHFEMAKATVKARQVYGYARGEKAAHSLGRAYRECTDSDERWLFRFIY